MLSGSRQIETRTSRAASVAGLLVLGLLVLPWLLLAAGLVVVGVLAFRDPPRYGGLEFCLLGGIALIGLIGYLAYYVALVLPRHTVVKFSLDDKWLTCETLGNSFSFPVHDLQRIDVRRSRRQPGPIGWRLILRGRDWVFLPVEVSNSHELIAVLQQMQTRDSRW